MKKCYDCADVNECFRLETATMEAKEAQPEIEEELVEENIAIEMAENCPDFKEAKRD